ncbi:MAG: right-handed parallel beta-helix repeat-containing protein [Planctomycetaceae bacterium]|nr:right-handed parallel beta-helix repeat-containing protein [Planctomycetaceae bacterium]
MTIYVSPGGRDGNPGTKERPLATLAAARDLVRRLKGKNPGQDFIVLLGSGVYRLSKTLVFGLADSAADGHSITYAAARGQKAVLAPDVAIGGWKKLSGDLPGLPAKARGKIYVAPMPKDLRRFFTLYDARGPLPRAKVGPVKRLGVEGGGKSDTFRMPDGLIRNWTNLRDVEVRLCMGAPWSANVLPIKSVDVKAGTATVAVPPTYGINGADFERHGRRGSTCIENTFEGLTGPGRWVLDTKARRVYLWPRTGQPRDIVAPCLTELIRVEGKTDYDGPTDVPVRGLVFRGLTFTRADRYLWDADHVGWGMQHDWELHDRPTAMVRLRGAENCAVENCRFEYAGSAAVRLDLHAVGNRVAGNRMHHIGGVGVSVGGYGPGTKNVSHDNEVVANVIHHAGGEYWHSPGIIVWQSGRNRIAHNLIHHMPYAGIVVSTRLDMRSRTTGEGFKTVRWHEIKAGKDVLDGGLFMDSRWFYTKDNVVELNEIHHVMQQIFDGNGIYISTVAGDTLCRWNFIHDCPSHHMQAGIRSDQPQDTTRYIGNVIWRCGGAGIGIVPKGPQYVVGNIIAQMHYDKQEHWAYMTLMDPHATAAHVCGNILYAGAADHNAYLGDEAPDGRPLPKLGQCDLDYNLYWNTADKNWGKRHLAKARKAGVERHSLAADPQFVNIAKGDLRLKATSPAWKLGFEAIPMDRIGPQGTK